MFETVKNQLSLKSLISMLTFVVTATQVEPGYAFMPKDKAEKLYKADPTFVVLDPTVTNEAGQIKVTATQLAIDAVAKAATEAPAAAPVAKSPVVITHMTLKGLPTIRRGGNKSESYDFDSLKAPVVGATEADTEYDALFVAASETRKDPAKALASTVASANKRYATKTPVRTFTSRKAFGTDGVTITGAYIIRTA